VGVITQMVDPALGLLLDRVTGDFLQPDGLAGIILGANVERQVAGLAAVGDELLGNVEVAFAQRVAVLQDVAPTPRADGKIH
jgi:hypothetical protein